MLKKITAALLAAMMALSLTACSGGDEKQGELHRQGIRVGDPHPR